MALVCDKCGERYSPTLGHFSIEGTNIEAAVADLCWDCRKKLEKLIEGFLPRSDGRSLWRDGCGEYR